MNQLPEAFLTRMRRQLEAEFEAYMTAMAQPPRRGGRVNGLKLSPEALFAMRPEFVPVGNEQFLLPEGTAPGKDPLHCAGAYYIQELSAQMPASLLDVEPGMAVLDLCAAPGGKSAQLGQALQGPVFDRVLVDAPCAGEGMFRKDPQAAAEWSPEHVRSCARRQRSILMSAQKTLKPGGMLVYSTCSFSPEENEETMEWFLSACPDFTLEQCRTLYPHNSLGEGQFAALLRRQGPLLPTLWRQEKSDSCPLYETFAKDFLKPIHGPLRLLPDGRLLRLPPLPFALTGMRILRAGLLLGEIQRGRFIPAHALALAAERPFRHSPELSLEEALRYLHGETLPADITGWCAPSYEGLPLGLAKGAGGILKNHLPKGLRM